MRREEAEAQAAWRNEQDERRGRLEFYAFDPSAGLADDAWEVSMRLRSEPVDVAPAPAPEPAPPVQWPGEDPEALRAGRRSDEQPEAVAADPGPGEEWVAAPTEPAEVYVPPERRLPRRRPRRRRGRRGEVDEAPTEPRTLLGRAVRVVGVAVIFVALLWIGATTALLVMIGGASPTGLALYGVSLVAGFIAMALGIAIRRS